MCCLITTAQPCVICLLTLSDTLLFGVFRVYALEKVGLIVAQKHDHGATHDRHWFGFVQESYAYSEHIGIRVMMLIIHTDDSFCLCLDCDEKRIWLPGAFFQVS